MVELIPGTSIPIYAPRDGTQLEGRGSVHIINEREPPAMVQGDPTPDEISQMQRQLVDAAIRAFDRAPKLDRTISSATAGQTDATTGNLVLELFECPQGKEGRVTNVTVDTPQSATITPAAPFANALSWAMLAVMGPTSGIGNTLAQQFRAGMVAFAPTSAAGPILPGQWTFNEDESPVLWGGQMLYYVLVGGSVNAILNVQIEASYRVNLYGPS
jgi:hypothetical protein